MLQRHLHSSFKMIMGFFIALFLSTSALKAEGTRLLRQPNISETQIVFTYGGDLWICAKSGGTAVRLTSTPAIEKTPIFLPTDKPSPSLLTEPVQMPFTPCLPKEAVQRV